MATSKDILIRVNYTPSEPPDEYRAYYDHLGRVTSYTTNKIKGDYIVISEKQYIEARYDLIVENEKLISPKFEQFVTTLVKNDYIGTQTSKYDINLITDDVDISTYWTNESIKISGSTD